MNAYSDCRLSFLTDTQQKIKGSRNEIASALYVSNYKFLVPSTSRAASRLPLGGALIWFLVTQAVSLQVR